LADCVAVDAIKCELVSAIEVPGNREIYREFLEIPHSTLNLTLVQRVISIDCPKFPRDGTGNFSMPIREFIDNKSAKTGNFS
jgi:hypothetical protein